jgi:hypothetical protein
MKKLKLRIAKFDRMLVVEQLELDGEFKETAHVKVCGDLKLFAASIDLQECIYNESSYCLRFIDNAERDEYAANLIEWITEEQFGGDRKLEIGKMCEISDNGSNWTMRIYAGELAPELGKGFLVRHTLFDFEFFSVKYARPLSAHPTIDGDVYTWEV